jgi:hypothetical protein
LSGIGVLGVHAPLFLNTCTSNDAPPHLVGGPAVVLLVRLLGPHCWLPRLHKALFVPQFFMRPPFFVLQHLHEQ